jgi:hypothetical protein
MLYYPNSKFKIKLPMNIKKLFRKPLNLITFHSLATVAVVLAFAISAAATATIKVDEFNQNKILESYYLRTQIHSATISALIATPTPTPSPSPTFSPKPTPSPTPTTGSLIVAPTPTPPPIVVNNAPPSGGFSNQSVQSDMGTFSVAVVAGDLGSTRVIVDTASGSDCSNNCPVLPLAEYVSRNGAYAGINGSFFCPQEYPSCAGKTGSFDTLLMNKNKVYFNSGNNVYSTIPAVIFQGGSMRFVSQSLEWGRDTGIDSMIANYPLLIKDGNIVFGGSSSESKFNVKGARNFVGNKGSVAYIGIVYSATMVEAAHVLKAMGLDNALNLDEGGSSALWYGGYKAGPGRNIPNAILFVRR